MMNQKEIQDLIKFVAKSGVTEVEIEEKDFKITIKSESKKEEQTVYVQQPMMQQMPQVPIPQAAPAAQQAAPAPAAAPAGSNEPQAAEDDKYITVKSPMIGTFYRSPSPDKPVFVEVGSDIKKGDVVCIIEAMKLFNEIESEVSGKIIKVLVDDATPVEYDQPLFLVDPA